MNNPTNPIRDNESQLIREVAERFLKQELTWSDLRNNFYWSDNSQAITPREHAHIIQLAEGKLSQKQQVLYIEKLSDSRPKTTDHEKH